MKAAAKRTSKTAGVKSAPKRKRSEPQEPDVRGRILRASRTLIEREGLSALSMREVARRAGVSHQAPYNHFVDREAILGALAEEGFVMLGERLSAALADAPDTPSRVRCGARTYVQFAVQHPAHFRLMFRPELVDIENCPGAKDAGDKTFRMLTAVLEEGMQQGLPAPSLDALIALCWSVCHGLACLILDGPLARKLPHAERDALIEGVTESFAAMMQAQMPKKALARPRR